MLAHDLLSEGDRPRLDLVGPDRQPITKNVNKENYSVPLRRLKTEINNRGNFLIRVFGLLFFSICDTMKMRENSV